MTKNALVAILVLMLSSCSFHQSGYPEEWGKRIINNNSDECPNISGDYVVFKPVMDEVATSLAGALLCSKEYVQKFSFDHTHLELTQGKLEEISIQLRKNGKPGEFFILTKNEYFCSDGLLRINCRSREDIYFSGYTKSTITIVKNTEGALVMNSATSSIGLLLDVIPSAGMESFFFRFLSSDKAEATFDANSMPIAVPR